MKHFMMPALILTLLFSTVSAQGNMDKPLLENSRTIIDSVAAALGGYDRINQIKTLSFHSIYPDHGDDPSIVEIGRPGLSRNPKHSLVYDGENACFLNGSKNDGIPEFIEENVLGDFVVEIALHFPAIFDYPTDFIDCVIINFKETYHLQTSLPRGLKMDYYVDMNSFLPLKAIAKFEIFGKKIEWERIYGDYKSVNGIQFPHKFTYPGKDGSTMYADVTKIEINAVEKNDFVIPEDILKTK